MMTRPVLVAHHDDELLERLTFDLGERGYHVVGPARTASVALALAAQSPLAFAVVGKQLAGRRDGTELAKSLRELWGVRSLLLDNTGETA